MFLHCSTSSRSLKCKCGKLVLIINGRLVALATARSNNCLEDRSRSIEIVDLFLDDMLVDLIPIQKSKQTKKDAVWAYSGVRLFFTCRRFRTIYVGFIQ